MLLRLHDVERIDAQVLLDQLYGGQGTFNAHQRIEKDPAAVTLHRCQVGHVIAANLVNALADLKQAVGVVVFGIYVLHMQPCIRRPLLDNKLFAPLGSQPLPLMVAGVLGSALAIFVACAAVEKLRQLEIDLVVLAGCMVIFTEELVKTYPNAIINVHPALIPSFCGQGYYGLHVHEEALKYGVKLSGATVHFVSAECDGGPIIAQKSVEVLPGDTPEVLQKRIMEQAEWQLLPKAVRLFCEDRITVEGRTVIIR